MCKTCNSIFCDGDDRTNDKTAVKKALCILLYAMTKDTSRMIGRILNVHHNLVYRWIREFGESLPEPVVSGTIIEMTFDEM